MSEIQVKIVFLLGAGASIPAGLSGIAELTKTFETKLVEEKVKAAYFFIKDVLEKTNGKEVDIENILQQLNEFVFGSRETSKLFYKERDKRVEEFEQQFQNLIQLIKNHLREKLEGEYETSYLLGLKGFVEYFGNLEIFSLNYDSVIETFCERQGISYTDGFQLYWNPDEFNKNYDMKLFKLHGSLYWFKTENGKLIKIPAKHVDPEGIKFYSDEKISETMVYPSIIKELELNPYSFLRNQFISSLSKAELLVVVGYSFRDEGWINIVKDQLKANPKLWIFLVDLYPYQIKSKIIKENPEMSERVICLPENSKKAFRSRSLNRFVYDLQDVMKNEKDFLASLSKYTNASWMDFGQIIEAHKRFANFSKIKNLVKEVVATPTDSFVLEKSVQRQLFPCSFDFLLQDIIEKDWVNAELWLNVFANTALEIESTIAGEYRNWGMYKTKLKEFCNLANITSIPYAKSRELLDEYMLYEKTKLPKGTERKIKKAIQGISNHLEKLAEFDLHDHNKFEEFRVNVVEGDRGFINPIRDLYDIIKLKTTQEKSLVKKWRERHKLFKDSG